MINKAKPTRVSETSQTTIDLIVTSDKSKISSSGTILCGLSDHHMIFCTRKKNRTKAEGHKTIETRNTKTYSSEAFNNNLDKIDWSPVYLNTLANEAWLSFKSRFLSTLNEMAPLRTTRVKARSQPWMNSEILDSMNHRDTTLCEKRKCEKKLKQHFSVALNTRLKQLTEQANKLRNQTTALINSARKNFVENKVEENKNKPRELWKVLKNQLNYGSKLKTMCNNINLKSALSYISDKFEVAKCLNIYFTTIATSLVSKLSAPSGLYGVEHINDYYRKLGVRKNGFKLTPVTTEEVCKKLSALNPNKATGHDKIPPRFLRDSAVTIAPLITHIINLSIKQGQVPQDFKLAKVTPLHKKGSKLDPGNYRPISILSAISKIIEKIVYEQIARYLEENRLIYEFQSGFRESHSTDTCLLYLNDRIKREVDSGKYCGMVMLDLQKAFDTVNHSILIDKLEAIGLDNNAVSWMHSYLVGREQMVEVNGTLSPPLQVTCGVPQGSILGPLLFLIYVNDMASACDCDLFLFADDSALLVSDKDNLQVEKALSSELNKICTWLNDNKLSIHLGKTESILFGSIPKLSKVDNFTVKVGNNAIADKKEITYLGCVLEANLSSDKMTTKVVKKVNQRIRFLHSIAPLVGRETLKTLARALIQPHFDYGVHVWFRDASKALKTKLQTAQNKLVRLLLNLPSRAHLTANHFTNVGWLLVADRVQFLAMGLVYKIHYTNKIPMYLSKYFINVKDVHQYNTRGSSTNHVQPRFGSKKGSNSFACYTTNSWNSLPLAIKECESLTSFKTSLKGHLQAAATRNWE